ncbi:competence type IV pilus minor pilin ComGF [Aeribacillus pallidus]
MLNYVFFRMKMQNKRFAATFMNNKGYTAANMLIAFLATTIIISSFAPMLSFFLKLNSRQQDLHPSEWNLFLIELHREIKTSQQIMVKQNVLQYKNQKGEVVTLSQYNDLLRYQVDGKGHVIVLRGVQASHFIPITHGVKIEITSLEGKRFEGTIRDVKGVIPD